MTTENTKSNTGIARKVKTDHYLSTIDTAESFEKAVDFIANSETYNTDFKRPSTDKDGNVTRVVDRNAIATCLILGSELGFKPMTSIMMASRLADKNSVVKVLRGRDLGISAVSAIQNIYVFAGGGGEIIYTSIHIVNKCLRDGNVRREVLEDGTKPFYLYFYKGEQVDYDEDRHFYVTPTTTPTELQKAVEVEHKVIVTRKVTRRALVKLTRKSKDGTFDETLAIPYTLIQATDAGLYQGINSVTGEVVKGKANWNAHPETHLVKMTTMLSARIIIGDILQGTYIPEELPDDIVTEDSDAILVD